MKIINCIVVIVHHKRQTRAFFIKCIHFTKYLHVYKSKHEYQHLHPFIYFTFRLVLWHVHFWYLNVAKFWKLPKFRYLLYNNSLLLNVNILEYILDTGIDTLNFVWLDSDTLSSSSHTVITFKFTLKQKRLSISSDIFLQSIGHFSENHISLLFSVYVF